MFSAECGVAWYHQSFVLVLHFFFSFSLNFKREISLFVCVYMVNHNSNFNVEGRIQINTEQPKFVTATGLQQ